MLRTKSVLLLAAASAILIATPNHAAAALLDPLTFTSQGSLNLASGPLTFDTDTLQVTGGGAGVTNTTGSLLAQGGGNPDIAVFAFSNVVVGGGVTLQVTGSRPIAILSQSNLQVDANLTVSGAAGAAGAAPVAPSASNGGSGNDGAQGQGGSIGKGGPFTSATEFGGKGGDGGYNNGNGASGSLGSGGASGGSMGIASQQGFVQSGSGGTGGKGANGGNGPSGTGGNGATGGPSFALNGGGSGNNGTQGTNGRGGGGGGGGGGGSCQLAGFCTLNQDTGGGGGAGGSGGFGGKFGQGGAGGRGIGFGAIGSVALNGSLIATGGDGGNGGVAQLGGTGGPGGVFNDDSGAGGKGGDGGNGGSGGAGGGGAGGTIYIFGGSIQAPPSPVNLAGGALATTSTGGISQPGGTGLFRFDGALALDVASTSVFDQINVAGRIDPAGSVHFAFANETVADAFAATFTLDSFFVQSGGAVPDVTPFTALTYSASSPLRSFQVTLNNDRSFTLTAVPEPASVALIAMAILPLCTSRQRKLTV
jgi:hypothetical protein